MRGSLHEEEVRFREDLEVNYVRQMSTVARVCATYSAARCATSFSRFTL